MRLLLAAAVAIVLLVPAPLRAQGKIAQTTIFLVRHAEKDTMKIDPPLTTQGRARAQLLARILGASGVHSTHSTQYLRTVDTVAPIDSALGITNEIFPSDADSLASNVAALVKHVLMAHKGEATLISSHSNILPMLIRAFGVKTAVSIGDHDYDNLFVITIEGRGSPSFVQVHMGME
jgi:broad specificity phosphatase PhoE